jgi:glycosyltransferase involved in cell wall biosynthesis
MNRDIELTVPGGTARTRDAQAASIAVITTAPVFRNAADGFAARLEALAQRLAVHVKSVLVIEISRASTTTPLQLTPTLAHVRLGTEPQRSRGRLLARRVLEGRPRSCGVIPLASLRALLSDADADVTVVHRTDLLPLARTITNVDAYLLEERTDELRLRHDVRQSFNRVAVAVDRVMWSLLYREVSRSGAKLFAISEREAKSFERSVRRPVEVLPHALIIDPSEFPAHVPSNNPPRVAIIGNFSDPLRLHGLTTFLAGRPRGEFTWVVAGRGTNQIGTSDDIDVIGDFERVSDVLATADVVVVPDTQGVGSKTTILEAWSFCIPVVTTAESAAGIGAARHRETVVVANSVSGIHAALSELCTDVALRSHLATSGRRALERHHDADKAALHLLRAVGLTT